MTAPIAVRDVAAAAGALLVLGTVGSVVGTVIVPRKSGSRLTRLVASAANRIFGLIVWPVASYRWRDRVMAGQGAVILLGQLAIWLVSFYVGYTLLIWPATGSIGAAFTSVGPALWTFGSPNAHGFFETAVLDTAAMAGLITVTLQIAYLPALYSAFNRRENEIALLNSRREPEAAWPHFVGWRVNYEQAAYAIAAAIDAVPALWSGPRRYPVEPMPPLRPRPGVPFP